MDAEQDALRRAGLTEYQAKCYQTLLSLGPATAAQVAEATRIPRTRIYGVLDALEGTWVMAQEGRPRTYLARDPEACLDAARREFDELARTASPALVARFRSAEQRFAGPLWILEGQEAVARRRMEMLEHARSSILLSLPAAASVEDAAIDALARAARRGVHVRIAGDARHKPRFERVRIPYLVAPTPLQLLIVDRKQGLLAIVVPQEAGGPVVKAIWNPNPDLALMLSQALPHALGLPGEG